MKKRIPMSVTAQRINAALPEVLEALGRGENIRAVARRLHVDSKVLSYAVTSADPQRAGYGISESMAAEIKRRLDLGQSQHIIAAEMSIALNRVKRAAKQLGVGRRHLLSGTPAREEQDRKLVALAEQHLSTSEIGERIGISHNHVYYRLHRLGRTDLLPGHTGRRKRKEKATTERLSWSCPQCGAKRYGTPTQEPTHTCRGCGFAESQRAVA